MLHFWLTYRNANRLIGVVISDHELTADQVALVLGVLGKRLARYGLTLHPDKTRFVDFRNNRPNGTDHPETDGTPARKIGRMLPADEAERLLAKLEDRRKPGAERPRQPEK